MTSIDRQDVAFDALEFAPHLARLSFEARQNPTCDVWRIWDPRGFQTLSLPWICMDRIWIGVDMSWMFQKLLVMVHWFSLKQNVHGSPWHPPHVSGSTADLEEVGLRGSLRGLGDLKSQGKLQWKLHENQKESCLGMKLSKHIKSRLLLGIHFGPWKQISDVHFTVFAGLLYSGIPPEVASCRDCCSVLRQCCQHVEHVKLVWFLNHL